eukprot:scaffold137927_cov18-Tisochrysis_lutea.AAC.2
MIRHVASMWLETLGKVRAPHVASGDISFRHPTALNGHEEVGNLGVWLDMPGCMSGMHEGINYLGHLPGSKGNAQTQAI